MRYLRTIMAHLARLLVRIARRLDDRSVVPAGAVSRAYIEDLRRHYPGAPLHWLEAFARRGIALDGPPSGARPNTGHAHVAPSPDPSPASGPFRPVGRPAARREAQAPAGQSGRSTAQLRSRTSSRPRRPALSLPASHGGDSAASAASPRPERQRKPRPDLRFASAESAGSSRALPVQEIPRGSRSDPFGEAPGGRASSPLSFPSPSGREDRPPPRFEREASPARPPLATPSIQPSLSGIERDFHELLSRWPALPNLDEGPQAAPPSDRSIEINLEQVIGTWSA